MSYRRSPRLALGLVILVVSACGGGGKSHDDAGADTGTEDGNVTMTPVITGPAATLPPATAGVVIAPTAITATGATPITWSLDSGTLPPGVTFDTATGQYSGMPTALGTYTFTIKATNASGTDSREFTLEVVPPPADAHVLLAGNMLASFNLDFPGVTSTPTTLTGVTVDETLVAMDRRPQNGMLYALGVNADANTFTLYAVATATSVVTSLGNISVGLTTDGATPVDLPPTGWSMDFNPAADRVRVVAGGLNFRINPNNGVPVDGDNTGLTSGTITGTNPDGPINTGATSVNAVAYTNDIANNGNITTLYTATTASLFIQNPPNAGTQTSGVAIAPTITAMRGFDIAPGVNAAASNAAVASGSAYAVVTLTGQTNESLVRIDLTNGQVSDVKAMTTVGTRALAVQRPPSVPMMALSGNGTSLVRFYSATPTTTTTQALGATSNGDAIVALDLRPHTGQLFALGINAATNSGSLYLVDPQTGALSPIGSAGQIGFVNAGGATVDLPDPATTGYAMDFNPTVDRIRVVVGTGLNFRVNPSTGAGVDGDLGGSGGSVAGVNLDGALNGSAMNATALAYTNNPGPLTTTPSTAYLVDVVTHTLLHMSVPNAGTIGDPISITSGGSPLAFSAAYDIDIAIPLAVATANGVPTSGATFALLETSNTRLYSIDLLTGVATDLGAVGAGTPLRGLAVGTRSP